MSLPRKPIATRVGPATRRGPALASLRIPAAVVALLGLLLAAGCGHEPTLPRTAYGPEGMAVQDAPQLAPVRSYPKAPNALLADPVDGVRCRKPVTPKYHVHAHLAIYVDGALRAVPGGIGQVDPRSKERRSGRFWYGPTCYYELHTHAQDGVVHVEAGAPTTFTLGQFFAVWGVPLSANRVGTTTGRVTAYVDGQPSSYPLTEIPLTQRRVIQLDVGEDVPPRPVDWSHF